MNFLKPTFSILFLCSFMLAQAQTVYFSEDFDGIPGPTAGGAGTYTFPLGWTLLNLDGLTPSGSVAYVNNAWIRREDFANNVIDSAAFSTSWYSPAGSANDWMFTPAITLTTNSILSWEALTYDASYPDGYEVRIMTAAPNAGNAMTSTVLFSIVAENTTWTPRSVSLSAYTGQTVYIAFRNNSNDKFLLLIDDIIVQDPCTLAASANVTSNYNGAQISCNGASDATAVVNSTGSTGAVSYVWSNGETTAMATALSAGTHSFTVTDASSCTSVGSVTVTEPSALTSSAGVTSNYNGAEISCNGGSDGEAMATASGGTGVAMYSWSNGQTTATATGLSAGAYSYTATDANNCTSSGSINVTEPTALMPVPDSFALDVLCNGDATGYVYVTIMGGTMPYTYAWSNGATTDDIVGLAAGVYSGTATDANGCMTGGVFTVTEPSVLTSSAMDNGDGSATAAGSGGSPSYSYMWDAAAGNQTTATATGLMTGTYNVTVTDINGCSSVASVNVVFTGVNHIATLNTLNIFPNPTNANVFVDLDLTANQDVFIRITNVTGQTVLENNIGTIQNQRVELNTSELSAGVYMVQFFIGTEMTTRKLVVDKR